MEKILEVENLTKVYDDLKAVDGVSFSIDAGEIVGLLGPNGAGKTTTISMILGILDPTDGVIRVFGKDIRKNRSEVLREVNFAAVYAQLPGNLTVWQNLFVFAELYTVPNSRQRIAELLRDYSLEQFSGTKSGLLSSGEQSRLNLAKALLNRPKFLLLDEPTASVDPSNSQIIRSRIRSYIDAGHAAALWTSHNMHEVEEVCDRALFISHGKILLEGKPKDLPRQYGKKDLEELFIAVAREPLSLH